MNSSADTPRQVMAPDFYSYEPSAIADITLTETGVILRWSDGASLHCHRFWLRENALGLGGIDPATREGLLDPAELSDDLAIASAAMTVEGHLEISWEPDHALSCYHAGWLRHIADGKHLASSWVPEPAVWTTDDLPKLKTFDAREVIAVPEKRAAMLNELVLHGACLLIRAPTEQGFLQDLAQVIGPLRDSNFGPLWDVRADVTLAGDAKTNTTANTGYRLGPHTDLPTREIPPGFQFLHCLINEAEGGSSTLTDGAAIVAELRESYPEDFELLSTRRWVFFNRGPGIDHRWSAPIIDYSLGNTLPTIRAFYPVRAFPDMPDEDVDGAYKALRRFHQLADDPRFELRFRLSAGDIMCFDNRRILHGRDAFTGEGLRHLQGIYIDRDEILSTARALNRECGGVSI